MPAIGAVDGPLRARPSAARLTATLLQIDAGVESSALTRRRAR
ncbi:hypothetical protein [Conexibacter sp. CPCC 206217]|nr:hypothetical protein [Conexibacter sp. CPCC 206217]MDO8211004.1 hypothetical protein [Conexibacter sp. CPCC 206217]